MNTIQSQDLSKYHWESRLILLLTDDLENEDFKNQFVELESSLKGLEERKVLVFQVFQHKMKKGFGDSQWTTATNLYKKYDEKDSPFEFYLIGLDGKVKLRETICVSIDKIFELIDSMPMRQQELRSKS